MRGDCLLNESNKEKAVNGNTYQAFLYNKYFSSYEHKLYLRNNHSYQTEELGRKVTDIEIELTSHPDIRLIFEVTYSLRDDRYWAKEIQANLVKKVLKSENKKCIYILLLPDDEQYGENSKEPKNNKRFEYLINSGISKKNGVGFIDLFMRESAVEGFLKYVDACKYKREKKIISEYLNFIS